MLTAEQIQLITSGGALGVMTVLLGLILFGYLLTKRAHEAIVAAHRETLGLVTADRDEWKGVAKTAIAEVGELAEALTVRNRIDEDLRRQGLLTTKADV